MFSSFEDCGEILENPVPDDASVDPYEMMRAMEATKFSSDHYLSDFVYGKQDYLYNEFVEFLPPWVLSDRIIRKKNKESTPSIVPFSDFMASQREDVSPIINEMPKQGDGKESVVKEIKSPQIGDVNCVALCPTNRGILAAGSDDGTVILLEC